MAIMTVSGLGAGLGFNIDALNVADLFNYGSYIASSTQLYLYDNAANYTDLRGSGVVYVFGPQGQIADITAGTVTSGNYVVGGVSILSISGTSASASALFDAYLANNTVQWFQLMLAGNDRITGTALGDRLRGFSGTDRIDGLGGADTLYGDAGNDTLVGGLGSDTLYGGTEDDTLLMDDFANAGAAGGADIGYGEDGNDVIWGYGGNDLLYGGAGNDVLVGNDFVATPSGFDQLFGGDGNDRLYLGASGTALLYGGTGNDILYGHTGADTLRGGTGNDFLYGNAGADLHQFYAADFAAGDQDIVYFMNGGDRLQFSASLNGSLFFQSLASLQYSPGLFTTGVYITAFLAGGATATITVYGMTVASLTPLVDYTL
jgi:Ca2+-binding RTX toxin-like protein